MLFSPNLLRHYSPYSDSCRYRPCHPQMQGQSRAYCLACEEDGLSRGVGEVAVHQGAYHQEVAVADDLQTFHCLASLLAPAT